MKLLCSVCGTAEANVLCCADEAALCWTCDEKVHAANKLASKHQRVPLSNSSAQIPNCDICQETAGFFFCLEDRALLCRKCDLAVHTANAYVAAHQRFLLTGIKAGLENADPNASSLAMILDSGEKTSEAVSSTVSRGENAMPAASELKETITVQGGATDFGPSKISFAGTSPAGSISQWHLDEFLGLNEFDQHHGYSDNNSNKADSGKFGDSDSSPISRVADAELDDERLGEVPDNSLAVPQLPSPPTASGLYWPRSSRNAYDSAVFVPDIHNSPVQNGSILKRRQRQQHQLSLN